MTLPAGQTHHGVCSSCYVAADGWDNFAQLAKNYLVVSTPNTSTSFTHCYVITIVDGCMSSIPNQSHPAPPPHTLTLGVDRSSQRLGEAF